MGIISGLTKGLGIAKTAARISDQNKGIKGNKTEDSTNGNTPGYENIWRRGKKESETEAQTSTRSATSPLSQPSAATEQPIPGQIKPVRLQLGWEQLLVAQKKLCEKARNIMTILEAPQQYFVSKKSKVLSRKHSGIILDFNPEYKSETALRKEAEERDENTAATEEAVKIDRAA